MAKLFEEVYNGTSSSADLVISFACGVHDDNSSSSPRQRTTRAASLSATCSPVRCASGTDPCPSSLPTTASIRCHSLILRTEPTLLQALMANSGGRMASGSLNSSACDASEEGHGSSASATAAAAVAGEEDAPRSPSSESPSRIARPREGSYDGSGCTVVVDDEPEIFMEMLKFVYSNTCHVDHSNLKALMLIADKYGIEAIISHCLQWMQNHFTATLFYSCLSIELKNPHFRELMLQGFLLALRSRRHFSLITDNEVSRWEHLPVSFVEALLSSDHLPVASEAEVLSLLGRWAKGKLAQHDHVRGLSTDDEELPGSSNESPSPASSDVEESDRTVSSGTGATTIPMAANAAAADEGAAAAAAAMPVRERTNSMDGQMARRRDVARQMRSDMARLLRTFRKSDMAVKMTDFEPILRTLRLTQLFSSKPPRVMSMLEPGFMIYRTVAGVNAPAALGDLSQPRPNTVQEPFTGSEATLGARDWLQQIEGFKPRVLAAGGKRLFPRLRVKIMNICWLHREKRSGKTSSNISRHAGIGVGMAGESESLSLPSVHESGVQQAAFWLQDDWEIGRTTRSRSTTTAAPNISDSEKIHHRIICSVMSGQMQQGIRIGQRERASIYDIEDLYGTCDEVSFGGEAGEVEFELQLSVKAPNICGICSCGLAVLPVGASSDVEASNEALMQLSFDVSVEEPLHFHISPAYFDSNSSYSLALTWVLRPGLRSD